MSSDNVYAHTKAQEPHKNSAEEDFLSTFFSSSYDPSSLNSDILGPSVLYGTSEKSDFGNSSSNHDIDASSNIGSWLQTQNDDDFINLMHNTSTENIRNSRTRSIEPELTSPSLPSDSSSLKKTKTKRPKAKENVKSLATIVKAQSLRLCGATQFKVSLRNSRGIKVNRPKHYLPGPSTDSNPPRYSNDGILLHDPNWNASAKDKTNSAFVSAVVQAVLEIPARSVLASDKEMIEATAERYFGEMCRYFKKQDKENIGQLMFSSLVEEFKSCEDIFTSI